MFCVTTVGEIVSRIVTVAAPVFEFPLLSVTVSVTVFELVSAQLKELGVTDMVAMAQLSVDPLFTSVAKIVALPLASR